MLHRIVVPISQLFRLLALLVAAYAFSGSTRATANSLTPPDIRPNAAHNFTPAASNDGGLIFSATYSGNLTGKHYLIFRSTNSPLKSEFSVLSNPEDEKPDWQQDGKSSALEYTGRLVAIPLPAGNYEFRRHILAGMNGASIETATSLDYGFSVKPGKWTYLGNIHVIFKSESSNRTLVRTFISNERFRDLPVFHARYKYFTSQQVEIDQREIGEIDQRLGPTMDDLSGLLPPPDSRIRQEESVIRQLDELRDLLPKSTP